MELRNGSAEKESDDLFSEKRSNFLAAKDVEEVVLLRSVICLIKFSKGFEMLL